MRLVTYESPEGLRAGILVGDRIVDAVRAGEQASLADASTLSSVRAVIRVLRPYNVKALNDDYQDVRVLAENDRYAELEVISYPLNTNALSISANPNWKKDYAGMHEHLKPGITTNWRVTATRLGTYPVVCNLLCGLGHPLMRSRVHVVAPEQFPYPQPQRRHPRLAEVRAALAEEGLAEWAREMYARHRGRSAEVV